MLRNIEQSDRFGNLISDENNVSFCPKISRWCIKDCAGIFFIMFTWFLLSFGYAMLMIFIFIPSNYSWSYIFVNWIILHLFEFLAFTSHCRAVFTNPGTTRLNQVPIENLLLGQQNDSPVRHCEMCRSVEPFRARHCEICRSVKPFRARHCRICNRCVRRMDHHCVFINNCVGENNQKYFILFMSYTCLLSTYGLFIALTHIYRCVQSNWEACPYWPSPITIICCILTGLEATGFLIFTLFMTVMQLIALYKDATTVEIFNNRVRPRDQRVTFLSSLEYVFGSPFSWQWFSPFTSPSHLHLERHQY